MRAVVGLLLLGLSMLLARPAPAQHPRIAGQVVDAKTNEPIPFATVLLPAQATGTLTQKDGTFQLATLAEAGHDSLVVAPLGYARSARLLPSGPRDNLLLKAQPQLVLQPLWVEAKSKSSPLGSRLATPGAGAILGVLGTQYAFLCKNEQSKKPGFIRSVSFFIGESGFPRTAFRVRLYRAGSNGLASGPAADLLTESVIAAAARGGGWHTVDLSAYHIEAPQEGFFVAMEWLASCATATEIQNSPAICGQVVRPTFEFKESRTWSYALGKGWHLVTQANNGAPFNAMMKAEVEYLQ